MNNTVINIVLAIILLINIIIFAKYNKMVDLLNRIKKAQASIDIYSNKRFDLIPNLVECIKSYSKYEKGTIKDIVELRSNYTKQKNMNIKEMAEMNSELNKYLAIVEDYPELKANEQYMNLQEELSEVEDELESARHIYNDEVTDYNTFIESVPTNLVAALFGFKKASLFQIENEKKENVKIDL